jgi:AcrR family transcriptional regulator
MTPTAVGGLRERNRRRRVSQILEATRELLREHPHESPSVERIAQRAEVAPATVFNLIGPREKIWAALIDEMLAQIDADPPGVDETDPLARAHAIVVAVVDTICADAAVYRHVLTHWTESGRLLRRDPTPQLVACLRAAAEQGATRDDVDVARLAETVSLACGGAVHRWAAGLIGDRALRDRCRVSVDVAFAAAGHREATQRLA